MSERPDVVFLGPSLTRAEAREIYPEAILLPPAAAGDVISAVARYRPHAIALIDGAFMHTLATYHKELLDVLSQGIWVIGASSMGALRAAECARYGMIGVGQVYAGYASGAIEDDDEVALSHLAEEFDFRPVTEAMVNIRATFAAAVAADVVSPAEADTLIACQKERWFMERRSGESVGDAVTELGFDLPRATALQSFLRDNWVDVKAADARLALRALQELPPGPMPEADRPEAVISGVYGVMREHDLTVGYDENLPVTRDQIWRHFALTDARADVIVETAVLRAAVVDIVKDCGIELTEADRELGRAALAADLGVEPDELIAHAQTLDMREAVMREWIDEESFIIKLKEWKRMQRMVTGILDSCLRQLARIGEYESTRRAAGLVESMAAGSGHYEKPLGLLTALKLQAKLTSRQLPSDPEELDRYVERMYLGNRAELYERLATLIAAQREMFDLPPIEFVPADEEIDVAPEPQSSRGR